MANSADLDQLASKPTDLDLHCLLRQGISVFSMRRSIHSNFEICSCNNYKKRTSIISHTRTGRLTGTVWPRLSLSVYRNIVYFRIYS